jgi:purine-nucleoside phosphorylase
MSPSTTVSGSNPLDDPTTDPAEVARAAAADIARLTGVERHDVALTLGSGWGPAADLIGETVADIPATEVTGFTASAVSGHSGSLRSIRLADGRHALVIGARTHYYEGYGVRRVVHSVRTAAATGATIMVLTNGAGGIKEHWSPGTPVLISDHINLTADSPLEGATFIDLTDLYSRRLRDVARSIDPSLDEGVYVQFRGPHYETPAEVQMAKAIGGHICGMSTALEAIAARQAGMEVLGFSLITNLAAGISPEPLSHAEVLQAGRDAEPVISGLLARVVAAL